MQILRVFKIPIQLAKVQILLLAKKIPNMEIAQEMGLLPTASISRGCEYWLATRAVAEFQW